MSAIGLKFGGWVAGTKWTRTVPHIGVRHIGVRGERGEWHVHHLPITSNCDYSLSLSSFKRSPPVSRKVITSEREARSEFLLIYTKNLSMSGRPWSRF